MGCLVLRSTFGYVGVDPITVRDYVKVFVTVTFNRKIALSLEKGALTKTWYGIYNGLDVKSNLFSCTSLGFLVKI